MTIVEWTIDTIGILIHNIAKMNDYWRHGNTGNKENENSHEQYRCHVESLSNKCSIVETNLTSLCVLMVDKIERRGGEASLKAFIGKHFRCIEWSRSDGGISIMIIAANAPSYRTDLFLIRIAVEFSFISHQNNVSTALLEKFLSCLVKTLRKSYFLSS